MLSIIDLMDFIDLDVETLYIVNKATCLPAADSAILARQLLAAENGISILHHMFRDQIADAAASVELSDETELRRAYRYFSRKYPVPEMS